MSYQMENTEKGNLREIEDGVKMYKGHVLVKYLVTPDLIHSKLRCMTKQCRCTSTCLYTT